MAQGELIRELAARLGLDIDQNAFEVADGLLGVVGKGLAGLGILAGAATLALAGMAGKTIATAGQLDDLAAKTGLNVETLQKFGYAAGLGGVGMEALAQSLNFAARKGVKDLPKFMAETADEVARLNAQGRQTEAVKLALDRFGRSGSQLLPILKDGGVALENTLKEAEALGTVMGADLVRAGDAVGDNFDKLRKAALGFTYEVSAPLVKRLLTLTQAAIDWWKINRESVVKRFQKSMQAVGEIVAALARGWKALAVIIGSVVAAYYLLTPAAAMAGWAMVQAGAKAAFAWVAAAWPVLLLGLSIAAVILVVEDLYKSLGDADTMTKRLAKSLEKWAAGPAEGEGWWSAVQNMLKAIVVLITQDLPQALADFDSWFDKWRDRNPWIWSLMGGASTGQLFNSGGASSPAAAAAISGATTSTANTSTTHVGGVTIVQQPGQNGKDLATGFVEELERRNREAAAAVGWGVVP